MKVKKKKVKKSEEKPTRKSKKKSKFVNPVEAKSSSVLNTSNESENSLDEHGKDTLGERLLEKLARDTSTDSSMMDGLADISNDSSIDDFTKDTSNEEISRTEEPDANLDESNQCPVKETARTNYTKESSDKKPASFKPKKKKPAKVTKDGSATKDSTKTKVSVVKPKKFELTFGKKSKPTDEKKVKKIKKTSSPKKSGKENGGANQQECGRESLIRVLGPSVLNCPPWRSSIDHTLMVTTGGNRSTRRKPVWKNSPLT